MASLTEIAGPRFNDIEILSVKISNNEKIEHAVKQHIEDLKFWWLTAQDHIQHNMQNKPILFLQAVQRLMVCMQVALLENDLKSNGEECCYAYQYLSKYLRENNNISQVLVEEKDLLIAIRLQNAFLDLGQKTADENLKKRTEELIKSNPDFDLSQTCHNVSLSIDHFLDFGGKYPHDRKQSSFKTKEANYPIALEFLEKRSTFYAVWKREQSVWHKVFRTKKMRKLDWLVKEYDKLHVSSNHQSLEQKQIKAQTIKLAAQTWLIEHQNSRFDFFHNRTQERALKHLIKRISLESIRWDKQAKLWAPENR